MPQDKLSLKSSKAECIENLVTYEIFHNILYQNFSDTNVTNCVFKGKKNELGSLEKRKSKSNVANVIFYGVFDCVDDLRITKN